LSKSGAPGAGRPASQSRIVVRAGVERPHSRVQVRRGTQAPDGLT